MPADLRVDAGKDGQVVGGDGVGEVGPLAGDAETARAAPGRVAGQTVIATTGHGLGHGVDVAGRAAHLVGHVQTDAPAQRVHEAEQQLLQLVGRQRLGVHRRLAHFDAVLHERR